MAKRGRVEESCKTNNASMHCQSTFIHSIIAIIKFAFVQGMGVGPLSHFDDVPVPVCSQFHGALPLLEPIIAWYPDDLEFGNFGFIDFITTTLLTCAPLLFMLTTFLPS